MRVGGRPWRPTLAVVPFDDGYRKNLLLEPGRDDPDNLMQPWFALAEKLRDDGWNVATDDVVPTGRADAWLHLDARRPPPETSDPARTVVMIFEPEVVAPYWYRAMRAARLRFHRVFTYDLDRVASGPPYSYLYYPQSIRVPTPGGRTKSLVMINARKYPSSRQGELYSERERVAAWFARHGHDFAVYGHGWDRSSARHPVAARRTRWLRRVARGPVASKAEVLGSALFSLCFENMRAPGYRTEKLFDSLACGAIPVYYGDPLITDVVSRDAFVDYGRLGSPQALLAALAGIDEATQQGMRSAGRQVLQSTAFQQYTADAFAERLARCFSELR